MKNYTHDPHLYRRHFAGSALSLLSSSSPSFKGKRIQRGRGVGGAAFSFLRRLAVPLLQAAAPHIAGAASSLARKAVRKVFPKHKKMQRIVGKAVRVGAGAAMRTAGAQRRKRSVGTNQKQRKQQNLLQQRQQKSSTRKKRKLQFNDTTKVKLKHRKRSKRNIFDD